MENNNSEIFVSISCCAVLTEALITYFNQFFVSGNFPWQMLASMILGVALSVVYNIDITKYFNLTSRIPYAGCVISGILLSRGSNYIYDLISKSI